jgi:mono/diheme cytochrome c family protein
VNRLGLGLALGAGIAALGLGGLVVWQASQWLSPDPVELGEQLFRTGQLASGEAVTATVLGDVPVTGSQVLCASCHGRSGMGVEETGTRTPAIAGPWLFEPSKRTDGVAYTDKALVRALRDGLSAAGRELDPLMPRYKLDDRDAAAITAYLRQLGTTPPIGADDETLTLATVIADDAPASSRKAVLDVLEAFVKDKNAEGRNDGARARSRRETDRVVAPYRSWSLDVWDITGPSTGWRRQIEEHYREKQAFALVSGLAAGSWQPVHEFCEDHEVPCLLPNTARPPDRTGDFYPLYYSAGYRLEAQIMAADLARSETISDVVQLVDSGDAAVAEAAATLDELVRAAGGATRIETVAAGPDGDAMIRGAVTGTASAVVLWLGSDALTRLPADSNPSPTPPLYLSATKLDTQWDNLPEALRARTRVVDLYRPTGERDAGLRRFLLWAKLRGVEVTDERLQAQTYFACLAFLHGVDHTEKYLSRDYLMDKLEHAAGLTAFLPIYERGSLGPGQRFMAKGGHVIDASDTEPPRWVVP